MSRTALISSAVNFLRDPTTASSPLAQRIAFLESKGLTSQEIEMALAQANGSAPGGMGGPGIRIGGQQGWVVGARREYERDWRDWFIMAVVGGTVGYVAVKLTQKFIVPHLQPPSESELEAAQKALEAKYDEAAEMLLTLQQSTDALSQSLDEQKSAVEKELDEVRKAVEEMREGEKRREEWSKKVGDQVDEVVRGLPGVSLWLHTHTYEFKNTMLMRGLFRTLQLLEKQASASAQSLTDLQTELKSLKSLLIARRPTPSTSTYTPPATTVAAPIANGSSSSSTAGPAAIPTDSATTSMPSTTAASGSNDPTPRSSSPFPVRKPGIPAWQRSGASSASLASDSSMSLATAAAEGSASSSVGKVNDQDPSASGVLVEKEDAAPSVVAGGQSEEASSKATTEDVKE
ncbi:BZ3500_MvSof-1268-A1-R1_Chr12-1g03640 [Microbotryum saponariae]|uniref:Peroxisomal membrane protein PEX14 n=1 Tax=Microbotryum saponariae TaxID=289078 RepID=A0A2X0M0A4_9BASI|nr:BZ3500_MvSof-1268-A1-R1_Chr12-1g03640 [Microbotryum saponariae]SDA05233.1 BZ3501_MvSof-1269-A2-R1_Chr12-1g03217 [Microbotryum saponariae]